MTDEPGALRFDILTIFPQMFASVFDFGMIRQARNKGLLSVKIVDLRDFARGRHRSVDDRPYGGGEGMVLKPGPIFRAVEQCQAESGSHSRVILLSPGGQRFDQRKAEQMASGRHFILICGRYEGVDQRVADHLADEELSVGEFILSGGEFGAMVMVDAVTRLIPGVVGNASSVLEESFMHGLLDYPHYTRPARFRDWEVPPVLLSGDHREVREWREKAARDRTRQSRPDLVE